jgi:hypothetical protein
MAITKRKFIGMTRATAAAAEASSCTDSEFRPSSVGMTRYFFRADYRGISVNDDVGEEFSTLRDAEAHATIVANELVRNSAQAVTVSVFSEDGILLAKAAAPSG